MEICGNIFFPRAAPALVVRVHACPPLRPPRTAPPPLFCGFLWARRGPPLARALRPFARGSTPRPPQGGASPIIFSYVSRPPLLRRGSRPLPQNIRKINYGRLGGARGGASGLRTPSFSAPPGGAGRGNTPPHRGKGAPGVFIFVWNAGIWGEGLGFFVPPPHPRQRAKPGAKKHPS